MYVYVDDNRVDVSLKCNRHLKKLQQESNKLSENEAIVQAFLFNKNIISVVAWYNRIKIFEVRVPYRKGERYNIVYHLSGENKSISAISDSIISALDTDSLVKIGITDSGFIDHKENYYDSPFYIKKTISESIAKKEWKQLKKTGLVGKPHWDSWSSGYDCCCYACTTKGQARMALSVPSYGRLLPADVKSSNSKDVFTYKGKAYKRIPNARFEIPTFWDINSFEERSRAHKPSLEMVIWKNISEFESDYVNSSEIKNLENQGLSQYVFKTFDDLWSYSGKYWRDTDGNVSLYSHAPVIGAYERVWSPQLLEWQLDWDFDKLWQISLTQKEIDDYGNSVGGAWRDRNGNIHSKDWDKRIESLDEKVVTKGWHSTPYPNSITCPVCEMLYTIANASSCWKPWYGRIFERLNVAFYNIKRKFRKR